MYQFLDRRVSDLSARERLLVWSIRQWVASVRGGRCPCALLGGAFAGRPMAAAIPDLHIAMLSLDRQALRPLRFRHPACDDLGDDEAMLLALFLDFRDTARTEGVAEQLVRPEASRILTVAICRVAQAMAA